MGDRLDVVLEFHAAVWVVLVCLVVLIVVAWGMSGLSARGSRVGHVVSFHTAGSGHSERMDKLTRLRYAQRRIVRVQRRLWLAEVLMWQTVIAAGVSSVGGLVWFFFAAAVRRWSARNAGYAGAHEDGNVHVEPDGQLTRRWTFDWQRARDISTDHRHAVSYVNARRDHHLDLVWSRGVPRSDDAHSPTHPRPGRGKAKAAERKLNDDHVAERNKPPPSNRFAT